MSAGRRLAVGGQLIRARLHAIELQGLTIRIHRNLVVAIAVAVPHLDIGVEAVVVVVAKFPGGIIFTIPTEFCAAWWGGMLLALECALAMVHTWGPTANRNTS